MAFKTLKYLTKRETSLFRHNESSVLLSITFYLSLQNILPQQKTSQQWIIYIVVNHRYHHPAMANHINLNWSSLLFTFISAFLAAHTIVRPEASCGRKIKFSTIMEVVYHFPRHHHSLPSPSSIPYASLSLSVSLSSAPWRHVKCAQISVMGCEFITFTLRPFMRSHPREVCLPERSAAQ